LQSLGKSTGLGGALPICGFEDGACGADYGIRIVPTCLKYCLNHSSMFLIRDSCPFSRIDVSLAFELLAISTIHRITPFSKGIQ